MDGASGSMQRRVPPPREDPDESERDLTVGRFLRSLSINDEHNDDDFDSGFGRGGGGGGQRQVLQDGADDLGGDVCGVQRRTGGNVGAKVAHFDWLAQQQQGGGGHGGEGLGARRSCPPSTSSSSVASSAAAQMRSSRDYHDRENVCRARGPCCHSSCNNVVFRQEENVAADDDGPRRHRSHDDVGRGMVRHPATSTPMASSACSLRPPPPPPPPKPSSRPPRRGQSCFEDDISAAKVRPTSRTSVSESALDRGCGGSRAELVRAGYIGVGAEAEKRRKDSKKFCGPAVKLLAAKVCHNLFT